MRFVWFWDSWRDHSQFEVNSFLGSLWSNIRFNSTVVYVSQISNQDPGGVANLAFGIMNIGFTTTNLRPLATHEEEIILSIHG